MQNVAYYTFDYVNSFDLTRGGSGACFLRLGICRRAADIVLYIVNCFNFIRNKLARIFHFTFLSRN